MAWPAVIGECETLELVAAGASISRFGDGEFKLALAQSCVSQPKDANLARRLRAILRDSGKCLVGIPNVRADGPKKPFWQTYDRGNVRALFGKREYFSAFITRPDSAPWIDTVDYWETVRSLWKGKRVTLVRGSGKSLTQDMLNDAAEVREIIAPRQGAWAEYDRLIDEIGTPETALLCLGPTATVMAVDLCAKGVHAIDLGHIGLFLKKHERGLPMWVTKEEKAVDKPIGRLPLNP